MMRSSFGRERCRARGETLGAFGDEIDVRAVAENLAAARTGLRKRSTPPTPPPRRVAPSMMKASSWTLPSRFRKLPRPRRRFVVFEDDDGFFDRSRASHLFKRPSAARRCAPLR